jgi:hypothetical protein
VHLVRQEQLDQQDHRGPSDQQDHKGPLAFKALLANKVFKGARVLLDQQELPGQLVHLVRLGLQDLRAQRVSRVHKDHLVLRVLLDQLVLLDQQGRLARLEQQELLVRLVRLVPLVNRVFRGHLE